MEETYILRGGRAGHRPDHFTMDYYFRVEVFGAILDTKLTELNMRFSEKVMDHLSISPALLPKSGFVSFQATELCKMVEKCYPVTSGIAAPACFFYRRRAFSTLKIVKTRLCNKMEDDFLANSLLVHIEGELLENYSYDDIIDDFNDVKDRKVDF
ncbi:hypothetical protein EJB05_06275, partial [Eragrostis curvula]